jgi:arginine utilization regulatory protein
VIVHTAAAFATEDQAAASLFGVRDGVFTGVSEKPGLIREADGKALFLDEAHRLPPRLQGSLLRAVEQGRICRIGETVERSLPVYWDQSLH